MTVRRTDDPDIFFMEADPVQLWANGIVEFKIDRRNDKFLMTPIMRDGSEGPEARTQHEPQNATSTLQWRIV